MSYVTIIQCALTYQIELVMYSVYCETRDMVTEARISAHAHKCQLLVKYTTTPPP